MSVVAMLLSMLLYFPSGTFGDIDIGLKASAAEITPTEPSTDGNGIYQIGTAAELYWFAGLVNGTLDGVEKNIYANAELTADITVNSNLLDSLAFDADGNVSNGTIFTSWTPIGNSGDNSYYGTFDGQNHTISGLYFNDSGANYVGLFGCIFYGTVKNVGVLDSYFKGNISVGGVCGHILNSQGTIENCYHTGTVSGNSGVGGVCGTNYGWIIDSYNTGTVSGTWEVGGVCGNNVGSIERCYNTGTVSGNSKVGGVCGYVFVSTIGCFSTGSVNGIERVGGVCGCSDACFVVNCYYDSNQYSGDAVGYKLTSTVTDVEGKTTAQFRSGDVAYRLSQSYTVGRDTYDGSVWGQTIGTDNYPVLGGKKVYATTGCVTYNNDGNTAAKEHNYTFTADAHSCSDCGFTESHNLGENNQCTVCKTYAISNADQLYWFADQVKNNHTNFKNANAVLTADITVNTGVLQSDGSLADDTSSFRSWTPIGYSDLRIYTGTFDGQGHTVSGLYFNDSSTNFVGLFGCVGTSGNISNVGVVDSYFNGGRNVGGVSGYCNGKITNCYNQATVNGSDYVGGVCGEAGPGSTSKITSCYNVGIVKGKTYTACVVGYADSGKVSNCYYSGEQTEDDLPVITQPVIPIDPIITLTTTTTYRKITISRNTTTTTTTTTTTRETPGIVIPSLTTTSTSTQTPSVSTQATGDEQATPKTPEQFASGEVAYLLNGSTSEGTLAWGQRIGEDDFPVIDGTKRVYKLKKTYCDGSNIMDITGQPVYIYANSSTYILHSMTEHPAKEPTCTKAGNYAYWTCGYENGVYYKNEAGTETFANLAATVIPAHGHDMTEHSANAATCTEAGNYAYWTCSYENGVYYKDKDGTETFANLAATVIPAHGHDMTEHSVNAATCKNPGNYAYWTCSYENGVYYKDEASTDTFANLEATVILALEHEDTDNDGYCNNGCGQPVRSIVKEVSATLNGDIGLNYYIALPESVASDEGAYVQFTVNGQTTEVYLKDLTAEEDGTYKVTCWLTAKEMRDDVTFELYDGSGTNVDIYKNSGYKIEGASFDYSLETYFDALSSDENAALKNLADATLIYGAYAQNAFNHNADPALDGSELADVTAETLETNKITKSAEIPEGLKLTEMTLILETETTLRLYFKSDNIGNYTFKLDGADVTLNTIAEEGLYYVEIANISAKDLDTIHTLEINGECTLTFNALSYAYAVLKAGKNDNLCNVVKALYKYNEAANAYFGE